MKCYRWLYHLFVPSMLSLMCFFYWVGHGWEAGAKGLIQWLLLICRTVAALAPISLDCRLICNHRLLQTDFPTPIVAYPHLFPDRGVAFCTNSSQLGPKVHHPSDRRIHNVPFVHMNFSPAALRGGHFHINFMIVCLAEECTKCERQGMLGRVRDVSLSFQTAIGRWLGWL